MQVERQEIPAPAGPGAARQGWGMKLAVTAALLVVLLIGGAVRRLGIGHGANQYLWHPDVSKQAQIAIQAYSGTLDPAGLYEADVRRIVYPYGAPILLARALQLQSACTGQEVMARRDRWMWAYRLRWQSSLLFLAAAGMAFLCLRPRVGAGGILLGGLVLVLEPTNALDSHYAMNDVPMAAFVLLAWACCTRISGEPRRFPWASLATGLALGLAFGVKYSAVLAGIFPLAVWLHGLRRRPWQDTAVSIAACGLAVLAGVWLTCPMLQLDPLFFLRHLPAFLHWQANVTEKCIPLAHKITDNLAVLARTALGQGHFLLLLGGAWGTVRMLRMRNRDPLAGLFLASWLLAGLLTAVILAARDIARANDLLMIWPPLILMATLGLTTGQPSRRVLFPTLALAAVVIGWFGIRAFADAAALARPDTRELARAWCRAQIPAGSLVLAENYTLPSGQPGVKEIHSRHLSDRALRKRILRGRGDYVISSSLAHDRFFDARQPYYDPALQEVYLRLTNRYEIAARFRDRPLPFAHPEITIYRRRAEPAGRASGGEIQE